MKIVPSEQPQHTATMVPAAYCADCWPAVRGYLQPAVDLAHGRWTLPHILSAVSLGQQSLWIIRDRQDTIVGALTVGVTCREPNGGPVKKKKKSAKQPCDCNLLNAWHSRGQ